MHDAKPADILLGRSKALMEQTAGLHTEFEKHSLPHQRIPRCTHPRHEYLHSACCTFSGRILSFFFALRGLHRKRRGFTHTTGFKGLHSKKCAAARQRVFRSSSHRKTYAPLSLHLPSRAFPHHPTQPACPTHPWPRKTAPTVSMLSATGRPPEFEASV